MRIVLVVLCLSLGLFGVKSFGEEIDVADPEIRKYKSGFGKEMVAGSPECKEGTGCHSQMVNKGRDIDYRNTSSTSGNADGATGAPGEPATEKPAGQGKSK